MYYLSALPPELVAGSTSVFNTPENVYEWANTTYLEEVLDAVLTHTNEDILGSIGEKGVINLFTALMYTHLAERDLGLDDPRFHSMIQLAVLRFKDILPAEITSICWQKPAELVTLLDVESIERTSTQMVLDVKFLFELLEVEEIKESAMAHVCLEVLLDVSFYSSDPFLQMPIKFNTVWFQYLNRLISRGSNIELFNWVNNVALPSLVSKATSAREISDAIARASFCYNLDVHDTDKIGGVVINACLSAENPIHQFIRATFAINSLKKTRRNDYLEYFSGSWEDLQSLVINKYLPVTPVERVFLHSVVKDTPRLLEEAAADRAYDMFLELGAE